MLKKLTRLLSLCLIPALLFGACGGTTTSETTEPTEDLFKDAYHKTDPAQDDTLYILTAAASNSHYFLDEMYGILAAAGVKAKVCNLMRSSTGILDFHKFWKNNENVFQVIIHDENGQTVMEGMTFDNALQLYNWDVFNMQEGTAPHRTMTAQQAADQRKQAHQELVDHVRKCLPLAKLYYQQIWSYDLGFNKFDYQLNTKEHQKIFQQSINDYTDIVCKDFGLQTIPCGDAWMLAREASDLAGKMCARLSVNNGEGDYYHDGDIGGGQYLNGCVWFETLTGQSCVGNTFRPKYTQNGIDHTLSEELIEVLQNAAHQAVENRKK